MYGIEHAHSILRYWFTTTYYSFFSGYLSRKLCVRAKKQIVVVIIIINNSPWSQAAILALSQH